MRDIFGEAKSPPNKINTDLGGEFKNSQVAELMKELRIEHFFSGSHQKGSTSATLGSYFKL